MFKIRGETVVRWEATVAEESGELNAEDATAKACDEAEDAIAGAETFATLGVDLELKHHYTAASGCEKVADGQGRGEDHFDLEGAPRHEDGAGRTAVGRTLSTPWRSEDGATRAPAGSPRPEGEGE